jgi:hypothetical protein
MRHGMSREAHAANIARINYEREQREAATRLTVEREAFEAFWKPAEGSDGKGAAWLAWIERAARASKQPSIADMVNRFLGWKLPKDFCPDCGISFDGRKDDEWNKGKTWPIGTNLLTADQAKAMFEHCLASEAP